MKTAEEWLSESLRAKSGPENELVWIRAIQRDARLSGIQDCMGELVGGTFEWTVLCDRLTRERAKK